MSSGDVLPFGLAAMLFAFALFLVAYGLGWVS